MVEVGDTALRAAQRRRRLFILGALWAFVLVVLVVFRHVVLPFAGAALIAYLIAPLVGRITTVRVKGKNIPRWAALLLVYAAFFSVVWLAFVALVPQLYRELARISRDAVAWTNSLTPERISEMSQQLETWLNERGLPVEVTSRSLEGAEEGPWLPGVDPDDSHTVSFDLEQIIRNVVAKSTASLKGNLGDIVDVSRRFITAVLASVFMLFFVLMVAAFVSIDTQKIKAYVATLIPPEYATDFETLGRMMDRKLAGVVRGQVTICIVNGVLTFIGLLLLGVKFAFLLATIATVLSLIPIFGTIISSVPIVLIGLSQSWQTGLGALLWIIGIHALEAYVLNPKIMGTAARIHPIVVAFALIAGESTYGLIGALFAVPLAALFVAVFEFFRMKAQPTPATEVA